MRGLRNLSDRFSNAFLGSKPRQRRGSSPFSRAEALESRVLLTNFVVTSPNDFLGTGIFDDNEPDNAVSLREAILAANSNAPAFDAPAGEAEGDTITFHPSLAGITISLRSDPSYGELLITDDLIIDGGDLDITIDTENGDIRIFNINTDDSIDDAETDTAVENVTLANLTLQNGFTNDSGGAITIVGAGTVRLEGMSIFDSTAGGDGGGAIFNDGSTLRVRDSEFSGNTATGASGSGGAILNGAGGLLALSNSAIFDNTANRAGGGIEDASDDGLGVIMNNVTLSGNNAGIAPATAAPGNGGGLHASGAGDVLIVNSRVTGNVAASEGGGLWNGTGTMTVRRTTVNGNTASGDAADNGGGGIFNDGGLLELDSVIVAGNSADGDAGSGGGIFTAGGRVDANLSTARGNQANRAGGGVEIVGGRFFFSNGVLEFNVAGPAGSAAPGNGGGLHVSGEGSQVTFTDSHVSGNVAAREGGGIWNGADTSMRLERTTIRGNRAMGAAADDGGGGLFNDGGLMAVVSSTVLGNAADGEAGRGGGIFSIAGQVFVSQSIIDRNFAIAAGGGAEVVAGIFSVVESSAIRGNVASAQGAGNGGGVHISGTDTLLNVRDSVVSRNNAAGEGGGLWIGAGSRLSMFESVIAHNKAFGLNGGLGGGGLFNDGGRVFIDGSTIFDNYSSDDGGGLYLGAEGTARIEDTGIAQNVADGRGGGIYNEAELELEAALVIMNTASDGGGIFTDSSGNTSVGNSTVSGNMPNDFAGPGNVT